MRYFSKFLFCVLFFVISGALNPLAFSWDCTVSISGPSVIKKDQTITLDASGDPSGGAYTWWRIPNLVPDGSSASLTAFEPSFSEYIRVGITYTSPRGKKCSDVKYIWYEKCCANITGPDLMEIGETIGLSASGEPSGGYFTWENSNPEVIQLDTNGEIAHVTGLEAGSAKITLTYDFPESQFQCKSFLEITVSSQCSIQLFGTNVMSVGNHDYVTAETTPENGNLTWTPHPNIESINDNSIYHSSGTPGTYTYEATYTLNDGKSCSDNLDVTFVKVNSFSGPYCVNTDTTLLKSDFSISTIPEGFNLMVNVMPLHFSTDLPYSDETITASIGSGTLDDATTSIMVVNSNNKFSSGVNVSVPNYVSEPLKTIGLSEKLNLGIRSNFSRYWECCPGFAASSVDGATDIELDVSGGPFTIAGIPLPKPLRNFITVDILSIGLSGSGGAKITGNYKGCLNNTQWTGGGTLSATVYASSEAKAKLQKTLILQGKLTGKTGICQTVKTNDDCLLVYSEWDGLTVAGTIKFQVFKYSVGSNINHPLIKKNNMPQLSISLPSLK